MDPSWVILKDFWSEIVMVRRSGDQMNFWLDKPGKGCRLVKRTDPGSRNVQIGDLVGLVEARILRDVGTKVAGLCAPRQT